MRELFCGIDSLDGQESVFLVVGDSMYVSNAVWKDIVLDDWYQKDCDMTCYSSEPVDRDRFQGATKIW